MRRSRPGAPRAAGRGYAAHRLLGRLAAAPAGDDRAGRPVRPPGPHVVTLAAVLAGATAVTLAAGLGGSLSRLVAGADAEAAAGQVGIQAPAAGRPAPRCRQRCRAGRHAAAAVGTRHYVAEADLCTAERGIVSRGPESRLVR